MNSNDEGQPDGPVHDGADGESGLQALQLHVPASWLGPPCAPCFISTDAYEYRCRATANCETCERRVTCRRDPARGDLALYLPGRVVARAGLGVGTGRCRRRRCLEPLNAGRELSSSGGGPEDSPQKGCKRLGLAGIREASNAIEDPAPSRSSPLRAGWPSQAKRRPGVLPLA
jgi:hypothetical protein